ncbi:MAG: PilW family protein [Gammaproteobacteria bacterium]
MRCSENRLHKQTGLSLVELMIATVVGLILLAGVLSIFLSSRQSYGINSAVGQIQESGRFALDFMSTATRKAGYMGCATSNNIANYLAPAGGPYLLAYNFGTGITGFEYMGTGPGAAYVMAGEDPAPVAAGNWSPSLDPTLPVAGAAYAIAGSDVLVVRYSMNDPTYVTSIGVGSFTVANNTTIMANNLVLVTDCASGVVQQATAATAGLGGAITTAIGGPSPGDAMPNLPASYLNAQVVTPTTTVFFVGQGADNFPALFEGVTTTGIASGFTFQELVPGVENMQVLYGVDLTGSMVPSQYFTANAVTAAGNWPNVVSVRIALLLRSATGAVSIPAAAPSYCLLQTCITVPQDTRLRQVFTTTVAIRNPQG